MYTHTHTRTHTHIYIYSNINKYIKKSQDEECCNPGIQWCPQAGQGSERWVFRISTNSCHFQPRALMYPHTF